MRPLVEDSKNGCPFSLKKAKIKRTKANEKDLKKEVGLIWL